MKQTKQKSLVMTGSPEEGSASMGWHCWLWEMGGAITDIFTLLKACKGKEN